MPHHVPVGVITEDEIVLLRLDRLAEDVGDAGRAHLRHEVVGGDFLGGDEDALFAGIRGLDAAIEEVGDVGVLLCLGSAEHRLAALRKDLGDDARQHRRPERDREREGLVVLSHGREPDPWPPARVEGVEPFERERAHDLAHPVGAGSSCRCPSITAATRWWSSACTPPLPIRPSRWRVCPVRRSSPHSSTSAGMWKKAPESIACEMRTMSCGTTRPAPRFRCPTSLLPIWLSGSPTASPDALSSVRGAFAQRRCHVGVRPSSIAFPVWPGRKPQPSSTIRTTGVRGPCLFAILEGMQFSHALRALPVVCSLAPALPATSPDTAVQAAARYRVATDGEWFYQEVTGKRLARLARGAVVAGGDTKGEWIGVTLEGWIFGTSVGVTPRAGFDLAVTRAPEENLRAAPGGTIIAKLAEGFLLTKLGENGPWVHAARAGWVKG